MASPLTQTTEISLSRGTLSVSVSRSSLTPSTAVFFLPGLLGSQKLWSSVLGRLPQGFDAISADFAGRYGSYDCDAEWGIDRHVADVVETSRTLGYEHLLVVGYSFGAFVGCRLAERFEEIVTGLVLIDGGVNLSFGLAESPDEALKQYLGSSWQHIESTYQSHEACLAAWRADPRFASVLPQTLDEYTSYGLVGAAPNIRYRLAKESILSDGFELLGDGSAISALARIRHPVELLRSEHSDGVGLTPLVSDGSVATFLGVKPDLRCVTVPGSNHASLPLTVAGADAINASIQRVAARSRHEDHNY